nr:C572 [uncultured bacterium]
MNRSTAAKSCLDRERQAREALAFRLPAVCLRYAAGKLAS